MQNVIKVNTNQSAIRQTILSAVESGVRSALANMSNAQLKELILAPYREIAMNAELQKRKAA